MVSPRPVVPFPLSLIVAVLVTSIDELLGGVIVVRVIVGSFSVLPSVSSPSSEMSLTTVPPGLVATAATVLDTPPALTA